MARIGAAATLLGVAGLTMFLLVDVPGGAVGVAVTGLLTALGALWTQRAVRRSRFAEQLVAGDGVLARWALDSSVAAAFLDEKMADERASLRRCLFVGGAIVAAASILVVTLDPDGGWAGVGALLAAAILLSGAALIGPRFVRAARGKALPQAAIANDGAYVLGIVYVWAPGAARVRDASIVSGEPPELRVVYRVPTHLGGGYAVASIPIPPGAESSAAETARALREVRTAGRRESSRAF